MERDLQIHPPSLATLRAELAALLAHFLNLGFEACELMFGWAWREGSNDPEPSWKIFRAPLGEVEGAIGDEQAAGLGEFGRDEVWLLIGGKRLKVRFCQNAGLHLLYAGPDPLAEPFYARWDAAGLAPTEWEKDPDRPGWTLLRGTPPPSDASTPGAPVPSWRPCP